MPRITTDGRCVSLDGPKLVALAKLMARPLAIQLLPEIFALPGFCRQHFLISG